MTPTLFDVPADPYSPREAQQRVRELLLELRQADAEAGVPTVRPCRREALRHLAASRLEQAELAASWCPPAVRAGLERELGQVRARWHNLPVLNQELPFDPGADDEP